MPFLRRRGIQTSDADIRRRTMFVDSDASQDDSFSSTQQPPNNTTDVDEDDAPTQRVEADSNASRPDTPPIQEETSKHKRFSVLRFRNASDSQLSLKAKQQAEQPPPVPRPPAIITTAPTNEINTPRKIKSRMSLAGRFRRSNDIQRPSDDIQQTAPAARQTRKSFNDARGRPSMATLEEPQSPQVESRTSTASNGVSLKATVHRQSESSRSDVSSVDTGAGSPSTTLRKTPTSSIFRLRKTKKTPEPLFPLAHLPQKNKAATGISTASLEPGQTPRPTTSQSAITPRADARNPETNHGTSSRAPGITTLLSSGARSGQSSPTRASILRGRSSTMSSVGRDSTDDHLAIPTTRTSTSTGRKSFGDLLGLGRIRQNSELSRQGTLTPTTPASLGSKSNSFQLNREAVTLPERRHDESAVKYLERIEDVTSRGVIAAALSKSTDHFFSTVLRSYMRRFSFFGDPMDMALRKLLMQAELPKETQQIDRFLQAFSNRYHECNPGIYSSPDQAYFIAFSLLILHTDVFNKNNKHKMQKSDYIKNTRGEGICDDILECFYDNISYTPFIHVEDDLDLGSERGAGSSTKKKPLLNSSASDPAKRAAKEPIDPYTLILDGNLDALRPSWKDTMYLEDHFNYLGTASCFNLKDLQKTFFRTGVLQIVSARSRPDAFMSEKTATNPEEAHPGIVDIKITKVGLLWRKDAKKRKTRSPWQEWGAILTGAQLYLFRNTGWIKNLMHQYDSHVKAGHDGIPIIFKPPLHEFKPDALMSTHGAVALLDTTYKKHKNAFVYVRQEGLDEVLLADNEDELNDWLAKLNYAAAFRTSGVKMRGLVGGNYDGQGRRGMRRLDSSDGIQLVQTPTGPVSIARGKIDHKMAEDIQAARREIMQEKITESSGKVDEAQKQLEEQLRNARHLQVLAPIQPRTREQLLSAAARMSAQLKWARMEIWKEKCHRDILIQDLDEDLPISSPPASSSAKQQSQEMPPSPTPKPLITSSGSTSTQHSVGEKHPTTPNEPSVSRFSSVHERSKEHGWPAKDYDGSTVGMPKSSDGLPASPSPASPPQSSHRIRSHAGQEKTATNKSETLDDMDAEERDLLWQAGLLENQLSKDSSEKMGSVGTTELVDQSGAGDRDKLERSKVRRSLQRTLRESAGHLSHHRSKKGREGEMGKTEDAASDSMLSRGTGSFVVHGKKASVINLGSEIQTMSQDERILALKQQHQGDQLPPSPTLSTGADEDFHSALETPSEDAESRGRRESAASASTATALSFRELHRKYSSAQAARNASASGRLTIPSDAESEAAGSFSEGRRSSLPPIRTEDDEDDLSQDTKDRRQEEGAPRQVTDSESETDSDDGQGLDADLQDSDATHQSTGV